jgi:formylglycine-generating enzyme required for sulfatase activity/tRNA A-37 threonylcarbamoyl transferase component Bud32/LysM repeat protein
MSELIGKELGPYRILEQIGVGGMATVYKAYHATMDRYVAVKVLPEQMSQDPSFRERFQREARVIAKLEHAHILPVHDYGEFEGRLYLVMRYVEAGTLKERMAVTSLSMDEINRAIGQVGAALAYAHRLDVVHRDVKPGNVLLDAQGDCYLTDFGLAKMLGDSLHLTASGVGVGTPAYMSPEQGQGEKVDARSDIYSLGVMLYEMVTGRVPFEAETPLAVVLKHITAPLPLPSQVRPGVPPAVERVILRALAKNPADRFAAADEMVAALQRAIAEATTAPALATPPLPFEVVPTSAAQPPSTRAVQVSTAATAPPRRRAPVWAWGVIGLSLLALVGVLLVATGVIHGPREKPTLAVAERTQPTPTATLPRPTLAPTLRPEPQGEAAPATPALEVTQIAPTLIQVVTAAPPTQAPALAADIFRLGDTWTRFADGMGMVYAPAGEFEMGSVDGELTEQPVHPVALDGFWIDRTEVTNAAYRRCVEADACQPPTCEEGNLDYDDPTKADLPVVCVDWYMARLYCEWAGARLPTEAEWEYAARGPEEYTWPWGDKTPTCQLAQYSECDPRIAPAGSLPEGASWCGALEMAGNVQEWVADWYAPYSAERQVNPTGAASSSWRVLRGGSWGNGAEAIRSAKRESWYPDEKNGGRGFRCAADAEIGLSVAPTPAPPTPAATAAPASIALTATQVALYEDSAPRLAWSLDGKWIAIAGYNIVIYDAHTFNTLLELPTGATSNVAFSLDGKLLAWSVSGGGVHLWDTATWSELRTLPGSDPSDSLAFSPDGKWLATATGQTVKLWDVESGSELRTLLGHYGSVYSVAFSPDGATLASGAAEIKLWDAASGQERLTISGDFNWVNSLAFAPDGKTLASGSVDTTVRLWDVDTGQELRVFSGHTGQVDSVSFSPDGQLLASASWDLTVRVWDVAAGQELAALTGPSSWIHCVAFSPDGTLLAAGSNDQMRVWLIEPTATLTHVVQAGDTLFSIAASYGVALDALLAVNDLDISSSLTVGQALIIPAALAAPETPPTAAGAFHLAFADHFDDDRFQWRPQEYAFGVTEIAGGQFVLQPFYQEGGGAVSDWNTNYLFDEFDLTVRGSVVENPGDLSNTSYGIMFGVQNNNDYYLLDWTAQGYYALWRLADGEWQTLIDWTFSGALNTGLEAVNEAHLTLESGTLTIAFNGREVMRRALSGYQPGYLGFSCTTHAAPGSACAADDFIARWRPPQPVRVIAGCNCTQEIYAGQEITVRLAWGTTTRQRAQDFIDAATPRIWVDDVLLLGGRPNDLAPFWQAPVEDQPGIWAANWVYPYGAVEPGTHVLRVEILLDKTITDGFDSDGDGKLDEYGPGTLDWGATELVVVEPPQE